MPYATQSWGWFLLTDAVRCLSMHHGIPLRSSLLLLGHLCLEALCTNAFPPSSILYPRYVPDPRAPPPHASHTTARHTISSNVCIGTQKSHLCHPIPLASSTVRPGRYHTYNASNRFSDRCALSSFTREPSACTAKSKPWRHASNSSSTQAVAVGVVHVTRVARLLVPSYRNVKVEAIS